jgi:hypothetical protein
LVRIGKEAPMLHSIRSVDAFVRAGRRETLCSIRILHPGEEQLQHYCKLEASTGYLLTKNNSIQQSKVSLCCIWRKFCCFYLRNSKNENNKKFQFGEYCVEEYTVCSTPVSSLSTENMETMCSNAKQDNQIVVSGELQVFG